MILNPFNRKASENDTDLNITPFLSLMVVLIPVLLVSAKFSLLAHYDVYSRADDLFVNEAVAPYVLKVTEHDVLLSRGDSVLFKHDVADRAALALALTTHVQALSTPAPLSISLEASYSYQEIVGLFDVLSPFYQVFPSISVRVEEEGRP
ncbi:hypothetical protein [Vibrio alginolyticus]|uniref:hypothetical protein n=1 Tax=Vibrio alginolyticus TaxID=663 RepID=UPI00071ECA5E|nr:hypothetical protein [Vibrio alginolyticus]ALR95750.1 hypothetical protein AT730_26305 [Vibrio alginolyticus]ALR95803.1 hypothetical protein AT730_24640 [Vibrio alginolyticus]MBY7710969.1 hypothetical protein [Vibrio alginolyticus]